MVEKALLGVYYLFFLVLIILVYPHSTEVALLLVVMIFLVFALSLLGVKPIPTEDKTDKVDNNGVSKD